MNRIRLGSQGIGRWLFASFVAVALVVFAGCEAKTPPKPSTNASTSQAAEKPAAKIQLDEKMKAYAAAPEGIETGLFIDRPEAAQIRFMTFNVNWDSIFPDVNDMLAERFQRIVKAVAPDVITLQEIGDHDGKSKHGGPEVAALLNEIDPLAKGAWHAYGGKVSVVIASRYPLTETANTLDPATYRDPAMALVDLPDDRFKVDLYVLDNHFKSNSREGSQARRQSQADGIISWIRDARTPGGKIDLSAGTPIIIAGDLNLVQTPEPLTTLLTGDIQNETRYGPDFVPDWDNTDLTAAHPLHNRDGTDDYTWRDDKSQYKPTRMDYVVYTDSVLEVVDAFVLNTTLMSDEDLAKARLEKYDVTLDTEGARFDHLPVIVDFRVIEK